MNILTHAINVICRMYRYPLNADYDRFLTKIMGDSKSQKYSSTTITFIMHDGSSYEVWTGDSSWSFGYLWLFNKRTNSVYFRPRFKTMVKLSKLQARLKQECETNAIARFKELSK